MLDTDVHNKTDFCPETHSSDFKIEEVYIKNENLSDEDIKQEKLNSCQETEGKSLLLN